MKIDCTIDNELSLDLCFLKKQNHRKSTQDIKTIREKLCRSYVLGRVNVSDSQRFCCQMEVSNAVTENRTNTLIQEDRKLTVSQIDVISNASVGTVYTIIHDKLQSRINCAH